MHSCVKTCPNPPKDCEEWRVMTYTKVTLTLTLTLTLAYP